MDWVKTIYDPNTLTLDFSADVIDLFPLDAGIYTVNYIIKNYPPPYTLMLSGGIDSQAMLWAWHNSGHKFNTLSARYNHDLNSHDLTTLEKFSSQHQIPITFVNFDLFDFLENEYDKWATEYNCSSPQICAYMKISSLAHSGTRIFSGNYIVNSDVPVDYTLLGIKRYSEITNIPIIPFFFLATPEIAYSFVKIVKPAPSITYDENSDYMNDIMSYQQGGYPVIPQKRKYTGFENVKDYYDQHYKNRVTAKHKLMISKNPSRRVFDILLRHPYETKLKTPKLKIITNKI